MKKLLALLLVVVLGCSLVACGGSDSGSGKEGGSEDKTYKVAIVTNAPIDDGGWNAGCYADMCKAAEENGFETAYTENVAEADYVATFTEYANLGFDLVIAPGNEFTDAIEAVAPKFPDTNFVIQNGGVCGDNYISVKCDNTMMGFIAGCMAGLKTKTNHVAIIGGTEITTGWQAIDGFEQGVKAVNPDCEALHQFSNSWDDAALGKEIGISMITTNDVDVFFGVASAVDAGVREGCAQYDDRYAICQPADYLDQNPDVILTSILIDNAALISIAMQDTKNGTFGNKVIEGGIEEGVLSLGSFGDAAEEVKEEFMSYYDKIADGSLTFDYNIEQ